MKKLAFLLSVVLFCLIHTPTHAQTANTQRKNNSNSSVAGAWQSADNKEFAMMNNGFFSSIGQDSTGSWSATHAGTYTVDNANTMTLKVLYSSFPGHIGALHTVEYSTQGENLTIKWFKKLVDAKGVDETAQMPQGTQTQYVRAKMR